MPEHQNCTNHVEVFIEISAGSNIKYEYCPESKMLKVNRFLRTSMIYPFNYGFIPNTISEDGDPVDALVLTSEKILPGTIIPSKVIGVLETEDEKGKDCKIICVPSESIDPDSRYFDNLNDLTRPTKEKITHFFEYYKSLEKGKWVKIIKWGNKTAAMQYLEKAQKR